MARGVAHGFVCQYGGLWRDCSCAWQLAPNLGDGGGTSASRSPAICQLAGFGQAK
ncbi:hypothetical protein [Desulfovibrio sp.]|uniref:hypothetical protein n=1 Tax=Desulfovibrio sp. TaxID=885 RepID=UPI0025C3E5BB|nr:hypothetical protein [Desulfovibrio sp.]